MTRSTKNPILSLSTEAILESISDGVFTVDRDWRITYFNRAAEAITGVSRAEALGRTCRDVFRSSLCGDDCPLQKTLNTGEEHIGVSGYIITAQGERLPISVSTAVFRDEQGQIMGGVETFRDLSEVDALKRELLGKTHVGDLTSRNPRMQQLFAILPDVAASPSIVLLTGETGTGKDLLARTIHDLSPHSQGPFVAVNCAALPETLLESELFGHKAGAFTGAQGDRLGRFAQARNGTIFLDEIGEVSLAMQVRLLRVIQERTFEPLGASKSESTNARIMAATNQNLEDLIQKGKFREDLYYRLNVMRLELPPLRERTEDIPLLVNHFIRHFNQLQGRRVPGIAPEALSLLMAHHWPGNIRELENTIERAFILCGAKPIALRHLPETLHPKGETVVSSPQSENLSQTLDNAHDSLDRQAILDALKQHNYNRTAAAKALGIHKSTLFRRIKRLGLSLPQKDGRSQ